MSGWSQPARRHRLPRHRGTPGSFPYVNHRRVTRRTALGGLGALGALALTGCDIRLEKGAPPVPGLQTQGPPADTAALQQTVAQRTALLHALAGPATGWPAKLTPVYQAQVTRVQAVMASAGMPAASATATSPGSTTTASDTPPGRVIAGQLDATTFARIAGVGTGYTPMLAAISAVDAAAAVTLGAAVTWPAGVLPAGIAAQLVDPVREAVYALEVVAARTPLPQRSLVTASLAQLYPARTRLESAAASSAPPAASSLRLVADPATAAGRTAIAKDVLDGVVAACAGQASATHGSPDAVAHLVQLWGADLALAWRWGVTPVPFPGLAG